MTGLTELSIPMNEFFENFFGGNFEKNVFGQECWRVDINPDFEFTVEYNKQIKVYQIIAATKEMARKSRNLVYSKVNSEYPGFISNLKQRWDIVALEARDFT